MEWDRIEGNWKQYKGKAKEKWGMLTDDDLNRIGGKRDQLEGTVQNKYGYNLDQAKQSVGEWFSQLPAPLSDASQAAQDVADNVGSAVKTSVKEQPMATLALVMMVGFVLGALWKS
jgi:uncharacterized protein YjbJ (UPF0337 family)